MTDTAPDLQRFGNAILLQGAALRTVQFYFFIGVNKKKVESRKEPTTYVHRILEELNEATRQEQRERHGDVAIRTIPEASLIDSSEAAEILGYTRRHVQRIARSLDGRRAGSGAGAWQFDRDVVVAYRRLCEGGAAA